MQSEKYEVLTQACLHAKSNSVGPYERAIDETKYKRRNLGMGDCKCMTILKVYTRALRSGRLIGRQKYVLTGTEVGTLDVAELCKPRSIVYYNIE